MERAFHRWLQEQITRHDAVAVGMGDDAAVLNSFGSDGVLATTDTIADGTHFELERHSLTLVGRKAIAVNLSDIAAMGGVPVAALLTFLVPKEFSLDQAKELFLGCQKMANEYSVTIIGGDTNSWDGPLVVGATLLGQEAIVSGRCRHWKLSTASAGDAIVVSGQFGGSILGHHLEFQPRVELAAYLMKNYEVEAATDATDSLAIDLAAVATASSLGFEVNSTEVPIREVADELSQSSGKTPLEHALYDGEDFELILSMKLAEAKRLVADNNCPTPCKVIGRFTGQTEFVLVDPSGTKKSLTPHGYSH